MIGDGRFNAHIATVGHILNAFEVLEERQLFPNKALGASHFRGMSYREVYEECIREFVYDYRLIDQSLLLFTKTGKTIHDGSLSFAYYESPVVVQTYREFVAEYGYGDDVGELLRADYAQYVSSVESRNVVTPIRYDCKASDYKAGVHPASHLHFGFRNNIRVATRRTMNPISFVLLIIRQCYPRKWEQLLVHPNGSVWCRAVRSALSEVDAKFWQREDKLEVALH